MKELTLSRGKIALVDDEDFEYVSQWKWTALFTSKNWYASRDGSKILLHRIIMRARSGQIVDHKDRNGLNCQKINLRFCTKSQNQMNRRPRGGTSRYKGVWLRGDTDRWQAEIHYNYKKVSLGCYNTQEEAAIAYNKAAKEYHGEFANLNLI